MSAVVVADVCRCGKPLRHKGRCIGFKNGASSSPQKLKPKMVAVLEAEISVVHTELVRLKREISERQHALITAEGKLQPLKTLLAAYENKQIEGPPVAGSSLTVVKPAPAPVVVKPTVSTFVVARVASVEDDDNDYTPIEADFNQVLKWAAARGIEFKTWDDLAKINERRTRFELPTFKKKLGR